MKGQRSLFVAEVTCFENALRSRCLIYPNFLFDECLVEMIMFFRSVVSWGKAMYQNAFFVLELSQNQVVIITGKTAQLKIIGQKFMFTLYLNLTPLVI